MMQHILVPSMIALAVLGGPAALMASAPVPEGAPLLVVAGHPGRAIARAGGVPLGPGRAPLAMLAAPSDAGFKDRLRRSGAWIVLDGRVVAAICGAAT